MSQRARGAVARCVSPATALMIVYVSTGLPSLVARAQDVAKGSRRAEPWSHLERMGEAAHGQKIYQVVASTALGARRVATVGRADGKFTINVWHVSYAGNIGQLATYADEAEATAEVKIAALPDDLEMDQLALQKDPPEKILLPFGHRFMTAARTANKTLKIAVWDVNPDGNQITKRGSGETEEIHSGFALAVFSRSRVVTAVRDAQDHLKLISWHVATDGSVKTLHDKSGNEEIAEIATATYDSYPPDEQRLATIVRMKAGRVTSGLPTAGKLKITSWRVGFGRSRPGEQLSTWGQFTELGSAEGGQVWEVAAATLSHRRIVTAARNAQSELDVQTWDFDAQGKVSLHSGAKGGEIRGTPDVTTQGGARVITSVLDGEDRLTLITWDAIDGVVRLDHVRSDTVNAGSIVPLGADWVATALRTKQSTLKVIAWREHGVSVLRGQWPVKWPMISGGSPKEDAQDDAPEATRSPTYAKVDEEVTDGGGMKPFQPSISHAVFYPGMSRPDAMVAVGFNHVIVSNAANIAFFDKKTGDQLQSKNGEPTKLSTTEFFWTFVTGTRADGSRNEHSINRHLALPTDPPSTYPPNHTCDPDASGPALNPCINAFFDTRVHFHPTGPSTGRFFIVAETRGDKNITSSGAPCDPDVDPDCHNINMQANQLNRRYFAFAVSRTEDPRDGFYQWMTTEPHLFDWPILTVHGGVLAISAKVGSDRSNLSPFGMKPSVYLFALEDLLDGGRYPRSHKLFIREAVDAHLVPLTHYGDTANRMFFVQTRTWNPPPEWQASPAAWPPGPLSKVDVYSFHYPSDWKRFPSIEQTSAPLRFLLSNPIQGATFRDGKIYLTDVTTGKDTSRSIIRIVRLPLTNLATKPQASSSVSDGYLEERFGTSNPNDPPGQITDYEWPSITANKDGHIVIVYRRKNPVFPEARYSILLAGEQEARPSILLRKGDCNVGGGKLDFQTAVVDPADDQTVWMAAFFAADDDQDCATTNDPRGDRIVIGKVKP